MATKMKTSKGKVVELAKKLIEGTAKHLGNGAQARFAGGSYTADQITSKLTQVVKLRSDVDTAKAATKARLAAEDADMPALRTFMGALVSFVKVNFDNAPEVLADFGIVPRAARIEPTVEVKTAAVAKRAATRAARHTMGRRAKKAVKGDVTGVTVTPVTAMRSMAATQAGPSAGATSTSATVGNAPRTA
jgi:hypothetical protein